MCGIAGYIGKKQGLPIVLDCLKKLEYRGYDSAGLVWFDQKGLRSEKSPGKLEVLEKKLTKRSALAQTAVIGHTRWATHGEPNAVNAHPHHDCQKNIFLVHNGIIENYQELKTGLQKQGHSFLSQTDTEVVAHLLEESLKKHKNFSTALDQALKKIVGAYALAIIYRPEPEKIYFARRGSPLIIGLNSQEYFLASDPTALAGQAKKVIYLKEGQRGWLALQSFSVHPARPKIENLDLSPEQAQKGPFPHFMLKEIFEEPTAAATALRGRLGKTSVKLGGLEAISSKLHHLKRLEIVACGTSYYAALAGELFFQEITGLTAKASIASEYRYRKNIFSLQTGGLFISQSGETADTLAALRQANRQKILTLGLVNVVGSSIARETSAGVYNHAGPEISVASTKSFISQLVTLLLISISLAPLSRSRQFLIKELANLPAKIKLVLKQNSLIKKLARKYQIYQNFIFIGRKYNYPLALEGALKLKEVGYVQAEGLAAGELKHGPIALIEPSFPTLALVSRNNVYEKMISNLQEIKARRGKILAIATVGDKKIAGLADDVVYLPKTLEPLEPILNVVPLQLFAYHFAAAKGYDVDQPRNLAKSVTVE